MSATTSAEALHVHCHPDLSQIYHALPKHIDTVTELAARLCDTPMAYVSFNDASRERFISCFGFALEKIPARLGFSSYVISGRAELLLNDTRNETAFRRAPLLQTDIAPRFYAGVPIVGDSDNCYGVLAVMDHVVRHLPEQKRAGLQALARQLAWLCEQQCEIPTTGTTQTVLEEVLDILPGRHGLYSADDLRLVAASRLVAETLASNGAEIRGKPLRELLLAHSDDAARREETDSVIESMQRVIETGEPNRLIAARYSLPRPAELGGGFTERFWNIFNAPVRDAEGRVAYVLRSAEDVTELVQLREQGDRNQLETGARRMETEVLERARAAEQLNEHLKSAQRIARVGSFEISADGKQCHYSDELLNILGLEKADRGNDVLLAAMNKADQQQLLEKRQRAFAGDGNLDMTHVIIRPDGGLRYVRQHADVIKGSGCTSRRMHGSLQDITEQKLLEQELRARVRQQEAVAQLGQQSLAGGTLADIREIAVKLVARLLDVEFCKVLELEPGGERLRLAAGVGWKPGVVGNATVRMNRDSQAGYTLLSDEPIIVRDLRSETRFKGAELLHDHGIVSGISVVIAGEHGPTGVLTAHTSQLREFTNDDVHFFCGVANTVAETARREQLLQESNVNNVRQAALLRLSSAMISGADSQGVLDLAAQLVVDVLGVDTSTINRKLADKDGLEVVSGVGWKEGVVNHAVIGGARQSMSGFTLEQGVPVTSVDVTAETRFRPSPLLREHGMDSCICVPVLRNGRAWGTVGACSVVRRHFTDGETAFLVALAELLAMIE